jgi:hypothetical protein
MHYQANLADAEQWRREKAELAPKEFKWYERVEGKFLNPSSRGRHGAMGIRRTTITETGNDRRGSFRYRIVRPGAGER